MSETTRLVLEFLGITSVVSLVGLYLSFVGFLPEIVIESVDDKSKAFNSESRLQIKNNGKLTANYIRAEASNLNAIIGSKVIENCRFASTLPVATRLSGGETAQISVTPGIEFTGGGEKFSKYNYDLTITYQARLLFLRKSFRRTWKIGLKNYPDGHSWEVRIT